jgi:MYXO-CTERM domain-containing protein
MSECEERTGAASARLKRQPSPLNSGELAEEYIRSGRHLTWSVRCFPLPKANRGIASRAFQTHGRQKMREIYSLLKTLRTGMLVSSLTLLTLVMPASAQNNNNNNAAANSNNTTTTTRTQTRDEIRDDDDDDRDWGWLGLLGLAGLLGLMPRKRVPVVHETREVRDRDRVPDTDRR